MTNKIQQARRAAFRKIFANAPYEFCMSRYTDDNSAWPGDYVAYHVECAWQAFNAALDLALIKLPPAFDDVHNYACYQGGWNDMRGESIDAIESTNLGIKVK